MAVSLVVVVCIRVVSLGVKSLVVDLKILTLAKSESVGLVKERETSVLPEVATRLVGEAVGVVSRVMEAKAMVDS